jgi:peptidoglycan/xylan/chitin deacetylase (PgdA/CDA1 family)
MGRFPVLMYHRIESGRCPVREAEEIGWAVSLEQFGDQMDRLRAAGRVGVSMHDVHSTLASGRALPASWVALTFDDGNASDHEHALPMLSERGFRATFFVCGNRVGATDGLAPAMLREMRTSGMHVGSHAMTHRFLTTLSAREEEDELRRSRELLESIVSVAVDHFAPPGGRWSRRTNATLRRLAYCAVSTSAFGYNDAGSARFAYRRLPVVRSTGTDRFDAMIRGDRFKLLPGYLRACSLALMRGLAGESGYGRLRAAATGNRR